MAVAASFNFVQGGAPVIGHAFPATEGAVVTIANDNDSGINNWLYELLDSPPGSAFTPATLSSGASPSTTFTPDEPGSYRIRLTVTGPTGSATTIKNIVVANSRGWILPSYLSSRVDLDYPNPTTPNARGWATPFDVILTDIASTLDQLETFDGEIDDDVLEWLEDPTSAKFHTAIIDPNGVGEVVFHETPSFKTSIRLWDSNNSHRYTFTPGNIVADRIINVPALSADDTMVMQAFAQPLTNKTLDSTNAIAAAAITSGQLAVARGGTGQDFSASSGFMKFAAGVASVVALATGGETFLTNPTSANLAALVTDEVGYSSGALLVFNKNTPFQDSITVTRAALGTTTADGVVWQNSTLATLGTPSQYSPIARVSASGWDVDGAAPVQVDFGLQLRPNSANAVSGDLVLSSQVASGGWTENARFYSSGGLQLLGPAGNIGLLLASSQVADVGNQSRDSIGCRWIGYGWDTTSGTSKSTTFRARVHPAGGASVTSELDFAYSLDGAAFTDVAYINSAGLFRTTGGLTTDTSNIQATNGNIYAFNGQFLSRRDGVTSSTVGLELRNDIAASLGVQQWAPHIQWLARQWETTGGTSKAVSYFLEPVPVQGADLTGSHFVLSRLNEGGSKTTIVTFTNAGGISTIGGITSGTTLVATTTITAGTGITATTGNITASAGLLQSTRAGIATTSTDGVLLTNTTAATGGVPVQYAPRLRFLSNAYNSTSTLSETQEWMLENRPATVAGATTSSFVIARSLNGAAYTDLVTVSSAGKLTVALNDIVCTGTAGKIQMNGGSSAVIENSAGTIDGSIRTTGGMQCNKVIAAGSTPSAGFQAIETTVASLNNQRPSPYDSWEGFGWSTGSSASRLTQWRAWGLPIQGAEPVFDLIFESRINSGTWTEGARLKSSTTGASWVVTQTGIGTTSTPGYVITNPTVALVGTPVQMSPYLQFTGSLYDATVGRQIDARLEMSGVSGASYTPYLYLSFQKAPGSLTEAVRFLETGTIEQRGVTNITNRIAAPSARTNTTGAGAVTLLTLAITQDTSRSLRGRIKGVKSDGSATYTYAFDTTAKNDAGTAAVDNTTLTAISGSAVTTTAPTFAASSGNVVFTSGDEPATTIRWTVVVYDETELLAA